MAAGDIRAGKAYVELFVKGDIGKSLETASKQLKAFGSSVTGIGKSLAGVGAGITAPLLLAVKGFSSAGSEISHLSERTGIATDTLQGLAYGAGQSGIEFEDLAKGLVKFNKLVFDAAGGSQKAQAALAALNLTSADLAGLTPDEQLKKVATGMAGIKDESVQAAVAMELFGKSGASLAPLLSQGGKGLDEMQKKAASLGIIMSKEDVKAAAQFEDTLEDLYAQMSAVTFAVGAAVAQALLPFANATKAVLKTVIDFAKSNRSLVIAVLGIGVGLLAAGAAIVGLGVTITALGAIIGGVVATVGFLGSALAVLLNPVVLIGGGLLALAGYFLYTSEAGKVALDFLGAKFNELKETASEAFKGIADALGAGDILLAGQILWTGLKLLFLQGTQELQNRWIAFKAIFVQVAGAAFYGALELYQNVKASLIEAWENTTATLTGIWDAFVGVVGDVFYSLVNGISSAWNKAINVVAKGIAYVRSLFDNSDYEAVAKGLDDQANSIDKDREKAEDERRTARTKLETENAVKREAERQANISTAQKDRDKAIHDINNAEIGLSGGADAQAQKEKDDLQKQKVDLQKQLDELRKKAGTEKANKKDAPLVKPDKLRGLDDVIGSQNRTQKALGIFNVNQLQSLKGGVSTYQERIAIAAEATAKNTKKLADSKAAFK